jgi:hypothetical protein
MISINVPLRPMDVHNFVYRESKVIEQKLFQEFKNVIFDPQQQQQQQQQTTSSGMSSQNQGLINNSNPIQTTIIGQNDQINYDGPLIVTKTTIINETNRNHRKNQYSNGSFKNTTIGVNNNKPEQLQLFYFNLKSKFDGLDVRAKLLEKPSLKAAYIITNIEFIASLNAGKSKLNCKLDKHCLSFVSENLNSTSTPSQQQPINHSMSYTNIKQQQQLNEEMNENTTKTTFDLPGIEVNGVYNSKFTTTTIVHQSISTKQEIIDLLLNVKVSKLNRELDADVIAQLVFVTNIFIKEINYILQAIYSIDNFKPKLASSSSQPQKSQGMNENLLTKIYYEINIDIDKISLTAITPTFTSLTICTGDKNSIFLTNNFTQNNLKQLKQPAEYYTLKPSVQASCKIMVDLKTCLSKQDEGSKLKRMHFENEEMKIDEEEEEEEEEEAAAGKDYEDWYKLSSFDTKIELQNTISVSKSKDHDREAIIITIDNPRFYLQPGAFDIAILFWLNYKSTYESWLSKRKKFADLHELPSGIQNQNNKANKQQQQQQQANNNDNNFLALKLHVSGLGLALPLSNKPFKDFKTNSDSLLITLNDTSIYACSSGCVVSTGRFSNFCLRFVDNFNLASLDWMPIATLDDENKKKNKCMPLSLSLSLSNQIKIYF